MASEFIDLDAIERSVAFLDGELPECRDALLALVRAVRAALALHPTVCHQELTEALAPFRKEAT